MYAVAESGRNAASKHHIQPECGERAAAKPVSQDQILRRERGQGKNHFPCPTYGGSTKCPLIAPPPDAQVADKFGDLEFKEKSERI